MVSIAGLFKDGRGVPQDYAEAMRWLIKAADRGYDEAAFAIGLYYWYGWGVPKNQAKAREGMNKAAAKGHYIANRWLINNP